MTMTVADVAAVLRNADINALTPASAPDWLKMIDFLRAETLRAIDEVAQKADALDLREQAVAEAEAVLATRQAAVERIMGIAPTPQPRRSMFGWR